MAKKPRHGLRPNVKSPLAPPSLRNGRKRNSLQTERKSRLEHLEERRMLTFVTGATETANLSNDWNSHYAESEFSASSATIVNGVWTYGDYDSGVYDYGSTWTGGAGYNTGGTGHYQDTTNGNNATQAYNFSQAVNPSSFDNEDSAGVATNDWWISVSGAGEGVRRRGRLFRAYSIYGRGLRLRAWHGERGSGHRDRYRGKVLLGWLGRPSGRRHHDG